VTARTTQKIAEKIRNQFEGTRLEPVVEAVRRARWPKVWRVGRRDHEALMTVLPFLLNSDSNCVDVGANQGELLQFFLAQSPAGRHIAFEPLPHHAEHLRDAFRGVTIHEMALSDQSGEATFFHTLGDDAYSGLKRTEDGPQVSGVQEIKVKVARLDDVIAPDHRIDLLKIDVEGAELSVLHGAKKTLERCKPAIVFEFQKERAESYGHGPEAYFEFLCNELDYSLFRVDGIGPLSPHEFEQVYEAGECYNFIAKMW
jgi:FkbM family methyltransferase